MNYMKRNIVFSTTRQWNPGDEIILKGIINIMKRMGLVFNSIIFNRNPDIRTCYGASHQMQIAYEENVHLIKDSMLDNSVKPWTSYDYVDAIVFAGTPEWRNQRTKELFLKAIEYRLPVYLIGIDSDCVLDDMAVDSVLHKAKFVSVRNEDVLKSYTECGVSAKYLPCPSIFCSDWHKSIDNIRTVGLIYRGSRKEVTVYNGWNDLYYHQEIIEYRYLIRKYPDISFRIICHYVDEVPLAMRDFPDIEIDYSYDAIDYLEIYGNCDYVIGSRIHGIGIAASLCIPAHSISYDQRGGTLKGFMPSGIINNFKNLENALEYARNNIVSLNRAMIDKKKLLQREYDKLVNIFDFEKVNYEYPYRRLHAEYDEKTFKECIGRANAYAEEIITIKKIKTVLVHIKKLIFDKNVAIRGAGEHTKHLLQYLDGVRSLYIVDDNVKTLCGFTVMPNEKLNNIDVDYVIISSFVYCDEMETDLIKRGMGDKLISIYKMYSETFSSSLNKEFYKYFDA